MASILVMPRQGNTVESCLILKWRVAEGDQVQADTVVVEVETDKSTFEVAAGSAGILLKTLYAEGDDVPVLKAIAVIGSGGEDWQAVLAASGASAPPESTGSQPGVAANAGVTGGGTAVNPAAAVGSSVAANAVAANSANSANPVAPGEVAASPRARMRAAERGIDINALSGTGPEGRVIERDVLAAGPGASLSARGGSLPGVSGSAIGGRVGVADIAASGAASLPGVAATADAPGARPALRVAGPDRSVSFQDSPIRGIRKVIADKMRQSLATTAQFTLNASAPAEKLRELRSRFKASPADSGLRDITVNDLVMFALSRTLKRYNYMNAHRLDGIIRTFEAVHLGMAVDTPRGLMVPVIRDADLLSLASLSAEAKRLAHACQTGAISPDDTSGSTFSVSNVGATGVESFTPVLNIPEVGILGVCGIQPKPVYGADGEVSFVAHIGFSLTINHEVVDGAPAARFLKALCDTVADIDLWLAK